MALDPRFITEAETLITEGVKQQVPAANVSGGSAIDIFFAKGASAVLAPLLQEQDNSLATRDLSDPDALSQEDFDLLFSNLVIETQAGIKSRGFIEIYYDTRIERTFQAGERFTTEDGDLGYIIEAELTFRPEDHFIDADSGDFYIRVPLVAEDTGTEYDAEIGAITQYPGDATGALRISNPSAFSGGVNSNTNEESLAFAQRSISNRNFSTPDGAVFATQEFFGAKLLDVLVIGNGDPEMKRDNLHDMGPAADPRFAIGRSSIGGTRLLNDDGTPIHVGGRMDLYIWFNFVNVAQQIIDLFADMAMSADYPVGVLALVAQFVPGTSGTVAASGKLTLEAGTTREETVIYDSFTNVGDVYTFTLNASTPTQFAHGVDTAVRVANNGQISIAPVDGVIKLLPILQIKEIRLLDPVSFEVIGDPVPKADAASRTPGWYISDRHESDSFSAKEIGTLVIDEKRGATGNAAITSTATAAIVSGFTELTDATQDFTGYQGRQITVTVGATDYTRTIIAVKGGSNEIVVLSGNTTDIPAGGPYDYAVASGAGEFTQFPIRVTFNTHTEIQDLQTEVDENVTRTVTQNILSRGFLPTFIDFTMRYKGDGTVEEMRAKVQEVIQQSAGAIVGQETEAEFDESDLISAAYEDGLANYVETPFQIRVRYQNDDGTETVRYVHPDDDTVNNLAIQIATAPGDQFVSTTRPASVDAFNIPEQGFLRLGGFSLVPNEVVEYTSVVLSGDDQIFVLRDGQTVSSVRPVGESVTVHVLDYDPDQVIEDGTITVERRQRPYLGTVLFEKIN